MHVNFYYSTPSFIRKHVFRDENLFKPNRKRFLLRRNKNKSYTKRKIVIDFIKNTVYIQVFCISFFRILWLVFQLTDSNIINKLQNFLPSYTQLRCWHLFTSKNCLAWFLHTTTPIANSVAVVRVWHHFYRKRNSPHPLFARKKLTAAHNI